MHGQQLFELHTHFPAEILPLSQKSYLHFLKKRRLALLLEFPPFCLPGIVNSPIKGVDKKQGEG